jgi:hypothetical protein
VENSTEEKMKPAFNLGDVVKYRGFDVLIRRVTIINGIFHYWILLPNMKNSYAMLEQNNLSPK